MCEKRTTRAVARELKTTLLALPIPLGKRRRGRSRGRRFLRRRRRADRPVPDFEVLALAGDGAVPHLLAPRARHHNAVSVLRLERVAVRAAERVLHALHLRARDDAARVRGRPGTFEMPRRAAIVPPRTIGSRPRRRRGRPRRVSRATSFPRRRRDLTRGRSGSRPRRRRGRPRRVTRRATSLPPRRCRDLTRGRSVSRPRRTERALPRRARTSSRHSRHSASFHSSSGISGTGSCVPMIFLYAAPSSQYLGVHSELETSRRDAAAATWAFRGDESRRRRGCHVGIPWRRVAGCHVGIPRRRVAATPRLPRGHSVETRRGDAVTATWAFRGDGSPAATWAFRGDASRRRRGCHVGIPWRQTGRSDAAAATWAFCGDGSPRRCHVDKSTSDDRVVTASPPRRRRDLIEERVRRRRDSSEDEATPSAIRRSTRGVAAAASPRFVRGTSASPPRRRRDSSEESSSSQKTSRGAAAETLPARRPHARLRRSAASRSACRTYGAGSTGRGAGGGAT